MDLLIAFLIFGSVMLLCVMQGTQNAMLVALSVGLVTFYTVARRRGFTREELLPMMKAGAKRGLIVVKIFILIGLLTALWRSGGTITFFVYHGIRLIPPNWFLLAGFGLTCLLGYVLSRKEHRLNGFLTIMIFIPMVFGGGLAASYVVNTQILHLGNTMWILILPLAVSSWNVIISRTFFKSTIPDSIIESAKMDGASQLTIFTRIVLPISKPVLATIGLFLAFGYWNDWFQAQLYISDDNLKSLQAMLNNIQSNVEYLTKNPTATLTSSTELKRNMPQESVRMAIAFVVAVPIACIYPFFQKYFISGLTVGAVKG